MSVPHDWFGESNCFTGPPLTEEMIRSAESSMGYKLPPSYLDLLRIKNGGTPRLNCYPTPVPTGWAEDHIEVDAIFDIAGEHGIDTEFGSRYMIVEWGYPETGIRIGATPSAGGRRRSCSIIAFAGLKASHGSPV